MINQLLSLVLIQGTPGDVDLPSTSTAMDVNVKQYEFGDQWLTRPLDICIVQPGNRVLVTDSQAGKRGQIQVV
jgi:hypothetical protein